MNKTTSTKRAALTLAIGATLAFGAGFAKADSTWPSKPVRIVVTLAAGGGTDMIGRQLATSLSKVLGQPVIVENRVGAGGNIGTDHVAKSAPDGYTYLLTAPAPIIQAMAVYKNLPYDPQKDLRMVSDIATPRVTCAVNASKVPARTVDELIAWSKANPGKLTAGAWGVGTQSMVVPTFLDKTYGTKGITVGYKGESQAINDLLGGQIMMACATVSSLKQHVANGTLRPIATIGTTRATALPDTPTFAEAGYPSDVLQVTGPISLLAPSQTPSAIVEKMGREVAKIVNTPELKSQIDDIGMEPIGNLPAEAAAGYHARLPVFLRSIRDAGVTAQ